MTKSTGARILCIDDDSRTCDWIKVILRGNKLDFAITTVRTGREAFSLINEVKFDLCILDYKLPDMSGVQLCSLIRRIGSDIPIMFFSAMNSTDQKANARAAGADVYLSKPGDLDLFAATVIGLLYRRRQKRLATIEAARYGRATA